MTSRQHHPLRHEIKQILEEARLDLSEDSFNTSVEKLEAMMSRERVKAELQDKAFVEIRIRGPRDNGGN